MVSGACLFKDGVLSSLLHMHTVGNQLPLEGLGLAPFLSGISVGARVYGSINTIVDSVYGTIH